MKPTRTATLSLLIALLTGISFAGHAQLVYYITSNTSTSSFGGGVICNNCDIIISPGVTVTVNSSCSCGNCTFSGGTLNVASGSNLTLTGVDSFKNETVLFNNNVNSQTLAFYGDSMVVNSPLSLYNSATSLDSDRIYVNSAVTLHSATFNKDSLHLNANLTLSSATDTFENSSIDVASGVAISTNTAQFTNNNFAFAGSSSMTVGGGMTSSGNNYYMAGTSTINSTAATTLSGDNVTMSGTGNKFTSAYTLTTTNTNFNLNGSAGRLKASQGFTATGGSITAASGDSVTIANATSFTNTAVSLTGSTFIASAALTTTGEYFTANSSSAVSAAGAVNMTNTATSISGSTFSGQSLTTSGGTINTASGSSLSITNAVNLTNTGLAISGSTFTGQSLTTSGGTLSVSSSTASITNAISLTNTPTTITSSTFSGQSLTTYGGTFDATSSTVSSTYAINMSYTGTQLSSSTFSGQSLTMTGSNFIATNSNISSTYAVSLTSTKAKLNGTSSLSGQSLTLQTNSWFQIGDGSNGSTANVTLSGSLSTDNSSTLGVANNNNYLKSGTSNLSTNTSNCGTIYPHACATGYLYGCSTVTNNQGPVTCVTLALAAIDLSATIIDAGQVSLTWSDNETTAADHYTIQRNTGNGVWADLGNTVAGSATGNYYFTDDNAPTGAIQYRIERLGENGQTSYSTVSAVTIAAAANNNIGIHPNPAAGGRFYINTPGIGEMIVNIYTSTGQLLLHTSLQGQTQYPIQLPSQPLSMTAVVVQTIYQNNTHSYTVLVH